MKSLKAILIAAVICCTIYTTQTASASSIHEVSVGANGSFIFLPSDILIELGDTVRWTWDSDGHNVVAGIPGEPTGAFFSGKPAGAGTVFEVVFDQNFLDKNPIVDNLYDYHCHPHAPFGMVGSVQVIIPKPCPWDLDGCGTVGTTDLLELLSQWGTAGSADFDESGAVGTADLLMLLAYWGPCP